MPGAPLVGNLHSLRLILAASWIIVNFAFFASGTRANRTIDDEYGDPYTNTNITYTGRWNYGPDCVTCPYWLLASSTYNSSWHSVQVGPKAQAQNLTITFLGRAIYIYGVLASKAAMIYHDQRAPTCTNLTFMLDDRPAGPAYSSPLLNLGTQQFEYRVPVFTLTGLANQWHKLDISVPPTNEEGQVNGFIFDYATYTFEDPSTGSSMTMAGQASPGSSRTALIPGLIGGIIGILILAACAFFIIRRRSIQVTSGGDLEKTDVDSPAPHTSNILRSPLEGPTLTAYPFTMGSDVMSWLNERPMTETTGPNTKGSQRVDASHQLVAHSEAAGTAAPLINEDHPFTSLQAQPNSTNPRPRSTQPSTKIETMVFVNGLALPPPPYKDGGG